MDNIFFDERIAERYEVYWPELFQPEVVEPALRTVELDVLSDTSVNAGIKKIIADNGRLDVVVHNAGNMVFGPLEALGGGSKAYRPKQCKCERFRGTWRSPESWSCRILR